MHIRRQRNEQSDEDINIGDLVSIKKQKFEKNVNKFDDQINTTTNRTDNNNDSNSKPDADNNNTNNSDEDDDEVIFRCSKSADKNNCIFSGNLNDVISHCKRRYKFAKDHEISFCELCKQPLFHPIS